MSNRALKIIEAETGGKSYSSHKYCYDEYSSPDQPYEDDQSYAPKQYGETERRDTPKNLKNLADKLSSRPPLFRYFLDGSRRTYKVDDIAYGERIYPIVAGQVGVACCERLTPDKFGVYTVENLLILCLSEAADKDGLRKKFFDGIKNKINSGSNLCSLGLTLSKILTYRDEKDVNYEHKAIAKIHDEMIDFEKSIVVKISNENKLNEDSYLIKDGSIEYKTLKAGTYKDLSVIKNNYRRVVGVSRNWGHNTYSH